MNNIIWRYLLWRAKRPAPRLAAGLAQASAQAARPYSDALAKADKDAAAAATAQACKTFRDIGREDVERMLAADPMRLAAGDLPQFPPDSVHADMRERLAASGASESALAWYDWALRLTGTLAPAPDAEGSTDPDPEPSS